MRRQRVHRLTFAILILPHLPICFSAETPDPNDPNRYLNAVRTFADNVLKYGRDTYGPKHTPLFVDGVNINTHEAVKWISPVGDVLTATETEEWILSNFASQQTLLRTLDGLSALTGDPKYRDAAKETVKYAFDNLQAPSGLFCWGLSAAYDAQADRPRGEGQCFKVNYPYYELMWAVDPDATSKLIAALWSAHVMDWSNLDFNRIGATTGHLEVPWNHEYKGGPAFFKSKYGGGGFFATATSLIQAGTVLHQLSHRDQPLIWSERLIDRFLATRNPHTGIATRVYNSVSPTPPLGDDLRQHFSDPRTAVFPLQPFEENGHDMYWPENVEAQGWISLLWVGQMLGDQGEQFTRAALQEFTAWGKASYRKRDNSFVPILTDGTSIEGYVCKKTNGYAPQGATARPLFADARFFWAYAAAYRATSDPFMWEIIRDIARGNAFGEVGETPAEVPELRTDTTCSDVYALLGFLEVHAKTGRPDFLKMACRIADNLLGTQFHKGFFVPSKQHIYARFDCFEPLALLHLVAAMDSKAGSVPQVWPNCPLFVAPYRYKQEGVDRRIIYTLTESPEPPLSLQEAAAIGDVWLVRSLLDAGIGVDAWDDSLKKTPLQRAAISGHQDIVALLLAKGARIEAQDDWPGGTALDYAAEKGHREIVELLIAKGADLNARRRGYPNGDTPLHSAARAGQRDIVELLVAKGANVNAKNDAGQTALDLALNQGRKDVGELLVAKGAAVSSIQAAARLGDLAKVKAFLEQGIDVNAKDENGRTALHIAAQNKHQDIVELLLSNGADVHAKEKNGYTPLFYGIFSNDANMVDLLVSKGADVNYTPEKGYPSLHVAVWYENVDIAKILMDQGAKCDVKDPDGWTAFRYAADAANRDMIELFVANGADVSGIYRAACIGDLDHVKNLVEQGAAVDANDERGWTPLYWAASMGQEQVGEFLLSQGARPGVKTQDENTPLYAAAGSGALHLAELLISKGANVNAKNKQGRTPLHQAAIAGQKEVVELLLSQGVDVTVKDSRGRTALDWAKQRGNTEIAELLRTHSQVHDIRIGGVSAPTSCVQGETISIRITIENPGDYAESVRLAVNDSTDRREIGKRTIDLLAGGEADLIFDSPVSGLQQFGQYVYHGDVNGDGYDDLLVTASRFNEYQGRAYLYFGGTDMDTSADIIFTGEAVGDYFSEGGWLGDLNGDGHPDVILGALGHDNKRGRVYVCYGGPDIDAKADLTIDGEPGIVSNFGRTCTSGDVNGDGYEDLFVGANRYSDDYTGRIYLYYGGESMDTDCDLILTGENPGDVLGWMIDASGDVDGDGLCDLVAATRWWPRSAPSGGNAIGRAYLYYGGAPMDAVCDVTFTGEHPGDDFGSGLEVADVDHDGRAEIFVGARGYDKYSGRVYMYWGKERKSMTNRVDVLFEAESRLSAFGGDDIEVGDIDADGYRDIAIAAYGYPNNASSGRVYLYHGLPQARMNPDYDRAITFPGRTNFVQFMTIGDFDNNGYGDLVVGGWGYPDGANQGRVWLYYGGPSKCTGTTFKWDTTNASIGKHTLKVEIPPVPGEQNTDDNIKAVTIEVKKPSQ